MPQSMDISVYLDNGATTFPKPESVYRAMDDFQRKLGGSAGRSGHWRAVETGRLVYRCREALADFFNVKDPLRLAFTKNATEAINIAIRGLLRTGDHVVTSSVEHNAVMRPLEAAKEAGVSYTVVECSSEGRLDPTLVREALRPETALIVVTHASNVAGSIMPVGDIAEIGRARGIPVMVDAAQSAGRLPLDVEALGIDFLAFTGHKELFGPQGTGGLYAREGIDFEPLMRGGTGSDSSSLEQPRGMPDRLESGTLNAVGIAGLTAGVEFVAGMGLGVVRSHELELMEHLVEGVKGIEGVQALGPRESRDRVGIVPLVFENCSSDQVADILDREYGIATRAGIHCSPLSHRTIGTLESGVVRVSFSFFNETSHVEYLLDSLREIIKKESARPDRPGAQRPSL